MEKREKNNSSLQHPLAIMLIFTTALAVCFYVTRLCDENRKFVRENVSLRAALEKERMEKIRFARNIKELELLLLHGAEPACAADR